MTESAIDVGKVRDKDAVFISVPPEFYERLYSALLGSERHAVLIRDKDVEWLIWALAKEIGRKRTDAIANHLHVMWCDGDEPDEPPERKTNDA